MSFQSLSVLIVDDHVAIRETLAVALALDGLEVVGKAGGGAEALELAAQLRPDLVVTDFRMEGMDGVELTRRLRRVIPETRVICISISSRGRLLEDLGEAGACWFIRKDTSLDEFVECLSAVGFCRKGSLGHCSDRCLGALSSSREVVAQICGDLKKGCY